MNILALETSTEYCSVALWLEGQVLERCERVGQKHSETLMPMLDGLLKQAGMQLGQLDGIAYGMGPGSFTGVRIACGVTQGLALGAGLKVAGVCTLEALAEATGQDKVIAALDARMDEVYHAAYERRTEGWFVVSGPSLCKPQDAPRIEGEGWRGAGSGFLAHGEALNARHAGHLMSFDAQAVPRASAIARLAIPRFAAGMGTDAALAAPFYLRDKVALTTHEREAARTT